MNTTRPQEPTVILGTCPFTGKILRIPSRMLYEHLEIKGRTGGGKSLSAMGLVKQLVRQGTSCLIDSGKDSSLMLAYTEHIIQPPFLQRFTTIGGLTTTLPLLKLVKWLYDGDVFKASQFIASLLVGQPGSVESSYGASYWIGVTKRAIYEGMKRCGFDCTLWELAQAVRTAIENDNTLRDASHGVIALEMLAIGAPILERQKDIPELDLRKILSTPGAMLVAEFDTASDSESSKLAAKALIALTMAIKRKLHLAGDEQQSILVIDDLTEALPAQFGIALTQIRSRGLSVWLASQSITELTKSHRGGSQSIGAVVKNVVGGEFIFSATSEELEILQKLTGEHEMYDYTHTTGESSSGLSESIARRIKREFNIDWNALLWVLRQKFHGIYLPHNATDGSTGPTAFRIPMPTSLTTYRQLERAQWPEAKHPLVSSAPMHVEPTKAPTPRPQKPQQPKPNLQNRKQQKPQNINPTEALKDQKAKEKQKRKNKRKGGA